jgi:hypothetical protein
MQFWCPVGQSFVTNYNYKIILKMGFPHPIGVLKFLSPAFPIFSWFLYRQGQVGFGASSEKRAEKRT